MTKPMSKLYDLSICNVITTQLKKEIIMIDVYEQIKPLLVFETSDDFYYLQILQRKKDNPNMNSSTRVITNYYITSLKHLDVVYDEIKQLCNVFNARAMLRLNRCSFKKVAFKTLVNVANSISNDEFKHVKKAYSKAAGNGHNDPIKKWIVDIDEPYTKESVDMIKTVINRMRPDGDKILLELPTKNGIHLITTPFNIQEFKFIFTKIDIHKNNPINLYIP